MEGLESFFTASEQLKLFLLSCLFGIPIGIVFDMFRVVRIILPHGKIMVAIEDIAFFVIYSIFVMSFTFTLSRSEFRFYFCVGNFLGFAVYYFTVGNMMVMLLKKIVITLRKILSWIFAPIYKKFVLLYKKISGFFVRTLKKMKMTKKNYKTPLIVEDDLLYNKKVHKKNKRKNVGNLEK